MSSDFPAPQTAGICWGERAMPLLSCRRSRVESLQPVVRESTAIGGALCALSASWPCSGHLEPVSQGEAPARGDSVPLPHRGIAGGALDSLHRRFADAGCDLVSTCTFGASSVPAEGRAARWAHARAERPRRRDRARGRGRRGARGRSDRPDGSARGTVRATDARHVPRRLSASRHAPWLTAVSTC